MAPNVSIVMTVFNGEKYLRDAIRSVLASSFTDLEVIVLDDGSSDRSHEVAFGVAKDDNRVRVIARPHRGRVASLAAAMDLARGEYVGWVDSDDLLMPHALKETVRFLDNQPGVGMVFTDYLEIDAHGKLTAYGKRCRTPYSRHALLQRFMTFHFRLFRRSVYDQAGGMTNAVHLAEDYDFCLRVSEIAKIVRLPTALYRYRRHPDQLSSARRLGQIIAARQAIQRALERRGLTDQFEIHMELRGHFELRRKAV